MLHWNFIKWSYHDWTVKKSNMLLLDKDTIMKSGLMSSLIWQSLSGPHSGTPTRLTENYAMHLKQRPTWIREAVCYAFCNEIYCHRLHAGIVIVGRMLWQRWCKHRLHNRHFFGLILCVSLQNEYFIIKREMSHILHLIMSTFLQR